MNTVSISFLKKQSLNPSLSSIIRYHANLVTTRMKILLSLLVTINSLLSYAQSTDTLSINDTTKKTRLSTILIAQSAIYSGSLLALNTIWYKDYPRSHFHFFNDNNEWLSMDKLGHTTTAYHTGRLCYQLYKSAGLKENHAIWYGGSVGFLYLMNIEILDGFSKEWGASYGDIIANSLGASTFIIQQKIWHEQRFVLKYSFHNSKFAEYRENVLGENLFEQSIKDYNGQTYWLSANLKSITKIKSIPAWLNLAIGYGADGMTSAKDERIPGITYFKRHRQFYLSSDIDFSKIKTRSKFCRTLFIALNVFKAPMPSIEYSNQKIKFWFIYF